MFTYNVRSTLMLAPRLCIVAEEVPLQCHCISRCARRVFLCGQGSEHRKQWIENRLKELVGVFAVECVGFVALVKSFGHEKLWPRTFVRDKLGDWNVGLRFREHESAGH